MSGLTVGEGNNRSRELLQEGKFRIDNFGVQIASEWS